MSARKASETSTVTPAANDEMGNIRAFCDGEWPDDYQMKNYCVEQQVEGFEKVKNDKDKIHSKCMNEWSKGRLTDWTMVAHCTEQERKAKASGNW